MYSLSVFLPANVVTIATHLSILQMNLNPLFLVFMAKYHIALCLLLQFTLLGTEHTLCCHNMVIT